MRCISRRRITFVRLLSTAQRSNAKENYKSEVRAIPLIYIIEKENYDRWPAKALQGRRNDKKKNESCDRIRDMSSRFVRCIFAHMRY